MFTLGNVYIKPSSSPVFTPGSREAAGGRKWARGSGETQAEGKTNRKFIGSLQKKLKSEVHPEGRIGSIT